MPRADIICLPNGIFQENCYLLADRGTGDAVMIDPGEEHERILERVDRERLTLRAVWLTHAHLDHVLGVAAVVHRVGVPVYLHPLDRPLYDRAAQQGEWFGVEVEAPPPPDRDLADGDRLPVGGLQFEVRHVPGHSPGSVAFVGYGVAIVGDALFAGSIGRVDLPGGNGAQLLRSIGDRLLALPDETIVYPGHGPETTIGAERESNPFLTGEVRLA